MLHFAAPLWPSFWLFVLVALPGLWLAHGLYGLPGVPAGVGRGRGARVRRPLMALICALAWLLLAAWAVSPTWRGRSETWHPPAVLIVVDESPRYAALGARDSSRRTVEATRAHYEARGFKVVEASLASLRDRRPRETSAAGAVPNLQAVLLWSDGRTSADSLPRFSTRVFPVVPALATREVQGESAFVADDDAADDEDGGGGAIQRVVVRWRALGQRVDARAEVVFGGRAVWSGPLPHPQGVEPGAVVTTSIAVPAISRDESVKARVLVRPARAEDNTVVRNDTLAIHDAEATRVTQVLVRPLNTLDERALVDALRADRVFRVRVTEAREVGGAVESSAAAAAGAGTVTWLRAGRPSGEIRGEVRGEGDGPLVLYHLASPSTADGRAFGPDARILRASGGEAFLPAEVVRLADLGVSDGSDGTEAGGLVLGAPRAGVEPMAWAEEEGRRGLLVWREKATGVLGVALPPLWAARFRPSGSSPGTSRGAAPALAPVWLRGVALWSLSLHRAARAGERGGAKAADVADVASKGSPADDLARIGSDQEELARLAARHDGTVLRAVRALPAWPKLPEGQIREQATRTVNLTPSAITALVLAVLFAGIWLWRKRVRLD